MTFPELFQAIEERRELIVTATHKVDESALDIEKLDNEIADIPLIGHFFETTEAVKDSHQYQKALADYTEYEYEVSRVVDSDSTKAIHQLTECQHELEHLFDYVVETQSQIQLKFHDIEDKLHDLEEQLDELTFQLSMSFADLASQMLDISHQIVLMGDDTFAKVGDFQDAVSIDLLTVADKTFSDLRNTVDEISGNRLPSASTSFNNIVQTTFDQMNQNMHDQANQMTDSMHESMSDMIDYVERDVMESLKDMFAILIDRALVDMQATLDQCVQTMSVGANIAGAIHHWMPAMKHIKEMVSVVHETTDSM